MQPDAAMLREFGLPVPVSPYEADFSGRAGQNQNDTVSSMGRRDDQADELRLLQQRISDGADTLKAGARGDIMADKFGRFKFREQD